MAIAQYPEYLPPPLQSGYSRNQFDGLRQAEAFAGPDILEVVTLDRPATYTLTWQFEQGQALLFKAWYESVLESGRKPFETLLFNESGMDKQEVRFVAGSGPQLQSTNGSYMTFSATVICRKIFDPYEDDYEELLAIAEISPNGNVGEGMRLLDIAINEDWPEA